MGIVEEYRQKLVIDSSRLQEMLETQASRHQWIVERSAEADQAFGEAKAALDVVKATAWKRLMGSTENGKAMTAKSAERYLPSEPDVKDATKRMLDSQYEAKILSGAVTSFQQRKTMLQKIAEREVITYYGDPKAKGKVDRFQDGAQDVLGSEMSNTNRGR